MNTLARGTEAELLVAAYCAKNGLVVSFPMNHSTEYDLIVDTPLGLKKLQIKRAYSYNNHGYPQLCVETRRILVKHSGKKGSVARKYSDNGYDFLIACEIDTQTFWIIPKDVANNYKAQLYLKTKKMLNFVNQWSLLGVDVSS